MAPVSKKQKTLLAITNARISAQREERDRKLLEERNLIPDDSLAEVLEGTRDSITTFSYDSESSEGSSEEEEELIGHSKDDSTQSKIKENGLSHLKPFKLNCDELSQLNGSSALKGLSTRAGFGSSERSRRRKANITKEKAKAASGCLSIKRMFERMEQNSLGESLIPIVEEPRAVVILETDRRDQMILAINELKHRLKSLRIQRDERLEGHWRTRHEMVLGYLSYCLRNPDVLPVSASTTTAAVYGRGGWVARRLRSWAKDWMNPEIRLIPRGEQGAGQRMSLWYEDEKLELYIRKYIASTGIALTAQKLAIAVGVYLNSEEHASAVMEDLQQATVITDGEEDGSRQAVYKKTGIRARAARRWLRKLGYRYRDIRKGIFMDGHERQDVVEYRQVFIQTLRSLKPLIVEHDEFGTEIEKSPMLGQRLCVLMAHDESTFSANDGRHHAWHNSIQTHLRPKSRGKGIMLSDVLLANKRLSIPNSVTVEQKILKGLDPERCHATEYFEYGKNNDGYWTGEHLVDHIIKIVIPIFELCYPDSNKYQGIFLFDNAAGHSSYSSNALRSQEMNLEPGGKAPRMKDGFYSLDNGMTQIIQEMSYSENHPHYAGQPKGLRQVLLERQLLPDGGILRLDCASKTCSDCKDIVKQRQRLSKTLICRKSLILCAPRKRCINCLNQINTIPLTKDCDACKTLRIHRDDAGKNGCCARRIMSLQPDFVLQKGRLQEEIELRGHQVLFFPKFHCELNWIEYYWGASKKYARDNCGYNIDSLRITIPQALDSVSSDLIAKYFKKSMRILQAYEEGVVYGTEDFINRVYKSHRRVRVAEE